MLHDNKNKNYQIVLKFGTDLAFIYLKLEFVVQKIGKLRVRYLNLKFFF